MPDLDAMITAANAAVQLAYAPYSKFQVGVCVKTDAGNLYSGSNIENASYGLTLCAEACAIANMVSHGEQTITEVVVTSSGNLICTPCGACRQRIREFATSDATIHCLGAKDQIKTLTLDELLPLSFGPENLD